MPTTQWTLIERLHHGDPQQSRAALDELCRSYHYPLYCQIRRRGLDHHDAEDVLHDFLAKLLRHDSFGLASSEKGRLRTYLLTALQRFLITWRRGQDRRNEREVSTDAKAAIATAEGRYEKEASAHHESPDLLYDRQWAQELMSLVMQRLQDRYAAKGKTRLFDTLRPVLLTGGSLSGHDSAQLAAALQLRPGALRTALMRLMLDYQHELRQEVLQTVQDQVLAKSEFQTLMAAFERH